MQNIVMMLKRKLFILMALVLPMLMVSCSCGDGKKPEGASEPEEQSNAFSAEALADLVEYERQKEGEGTEYNPWQSYGLKEMVDLAAAEESDFEYQDEATTAEMAESGENAADEAIPDADENYVSAPVVYYLGYNVDFNSSKSDLTAFTKKGDDGVGVIDRFDDKGSRIDILVYDKALYDDFLLKNKDQVRYEMVDENNYLSKDSLGRDVSICFAGETNGGYSFSIQTN